MRINPCCRQCALFVLVPFLLLAGGGDGDTLAVGAYAEDSTTTGIDSTPSLGGTSDGAVFIY